MATNSNYSSQIPTVKGKMGTTTGTGGIPVLPSDFADPHTGMFEVRLSKSVIIDGYTYAPGKNAIVVNEATKDALGDAVIYVKQL